MSQNIVKATQLEYKRNSVAFHLSTSSNPRGCRTNSDENSPIISSSLFGVFDNCAADKLCKPRWLSFQNKIKCFTTPKHTRCI